MKETTANKDLKVVAGFGDEWERFDQSDLDEKERYGLFERYFRIFPWEILPINAEGFDMGCGSGRWAKSVALRVGKLHCIDPSSALRVAMRNLAGQSNCEFHHASVGDQVLPEGSMDFGYSLGVLHHVPNTNEGIRDCVRMLKPGAPFLLYLYYALDNRSLGYRLLWGSSNLLRQVISLFPYSLRYVSSQIIAALVYWPLARFSALIESCGASSQFASRMPLGFYRHLSFYTMRTDSLDRFGTRLEQRFSRKQIHAMMESAGLKDIRFSDEAPFWCASGIRGR